MATKTKKTATKSKAKTAKPAKAAAPANGKMSCLSAAARLLGETKKPMTCGEMIERMAAKKYWKTPGGKTPAATLCRSITREIALLGKESRFKKTERGHYALS